MSMKEILERLDRIEKLLLNGTAAGGYEAKSAHAAEREWTAHGVVVAKLRADGGLELNDGPHRGHWTVIPGTTNPLTASAIDQLAKEAMSWERERREGR